MPCFEASYTYNIHVTFDQSPVVPDQTKNAVGYAVKQLRRSFSIEERHFTAVLGCPGH